jgi:phosphopantothenoylcysteine decarboxylase / phosphopantothenate---cysteine ligase
MLKNKKILIGVTGSIAAYKITMLVRSIVKAGAEVKIVMTDAAKDFVTPLSLSTLSKNKVLTQLSTNDEWANHVSLGRWADIMLIAPLSCNTLAKMANGFCDNLLLSVYLSATCPVVVAPAMDEDMWLHASTKNNLQKLQSFGNKIIPVATGELASGLYGEGRMAEPDDIVDWLDNHFKTPLDFIHKKVLITAGPTQEALDPVRYISNYSSGKMGIAIAEEMQRRGAEVTLVLGPTSQKIDNDKIKVVSVKSAKEMLDACLVCFAQTNIAIMSAAVADYTPANIATEKIKKNDAEFSILLNKTEDILKTLGQLKTPQQFLVGFALETNNEEANALKKLESKNADLIVLNSLNDRGAGFGLETNKITIFNKAKQSFAFETKPKTAVAIDIVNTIIQHLHA